MEIKSAREGRRADDLERTFSSFDAMCSSNSGDQVNCNRMVRREKNNRIRQRATFKKVAGAR
jgi:hypothetical protein